jgi:ubiquitin thioesterase protein OTUB1
MQSLTSAWLQTHPDQFQPYVDRPLRDYCGARIEPTLCEIEHVGMSALVDMLVKPAGIMVEILYLDRSPGTEANTFRWEPVDHSGLALANPPTIRLLYRPSVKSTQES